MAVAFLGGCAASSVEEVAESPAVGGTSATRQARAPKDVGAAKRSTSSPGGVPAVTATASSDPALSLSAAIPAQGVGATTVADRGDASVYRIGPLDVIEVNVFMVPELSKSMQVSESGTVNFPLIGETRVVGRTAREVEQGLTKQLGSKYLQDPQVSVSIKEYNSQRVTVEGSVKKPGVYALRDRTSLVQVLAIGGGLDELSDEQVVVSRSSAGGKRVAVTYDLGQIRTGAAPDPEVKPGDVIFVGKSAFKEALNNISKVTPIAGVLRPF